MTWDLGEKNKLPAESNGTNHLGQQMTVGTARNVGAAGWIFFNFAHRVKVHNNIVLGLHLV